MRPLNTHLAIFVTMGSTLRHQLPRSLRILLQGFNFSLFSNGTIVYLDKEKMTKEPSPCLQELIKYSNIFIRGYDIL